MDVTVDKDECHVRTQRVPITLTRDAAADSVAPLALERGARVAGYKASGGIHVLSDTLVISGRAAAGCGELDGVAFRSGDSWHIQFQPTQWTGSCPGVNRLQQFEARFKLIAGNNFVLVTHAAGAPVELFSGWVAPQ